VKRCKGITWLGVLSVITVPLVFPMLAGCGSDGPDGQRDVGVNVRAVRPQVSEIAVPIRTSGLLSAEMEMKLSFKTGGIVSAIHADEGDFVEGGSVLAELDLSEIEARAKQANNAMMKALRDLERVKNLYGDSVATLEQLQDATTAFEVAQSDHVMARFNLEHSRIVAPSDGTVLKRFAESSEQIGPGIPVYLFGSTGGGWTLRVGVADRDVMKLQAGDSASLRFDAWPDSDFPASVSEISGFADPMTGTYEVELHVEPGGRKLASGFAAKAEIFPSSGVAVVLVPIEALVDSDGDEGYVFLLDKGGETVRRVRIEVIEIVGELVAVGGLSGSGELVVTDGAPYLIDGAKVRVVE